MRMQAQTIQLLIAALVLILGFLVYLLDRPADRIYFVPDWWSLAVANEQIFGAIGNHLPSFGHVVAFILVTGVLLAPWRFNSAAICLPWFAIDSLFELAQHDAVAFRIVDMVPAWFGEVILLENTVNYFLNGTFDLFDILSIAAGTLLAYLILKGYRLQEDKDEYQN